MTDTVTTDPHPPLRPREKFAQLETDAFCVGCGYNLHAQPVTRDERLGIFVCRCPECGKFHPAGTGVTAQSVWMTRIATAFLVVWVLFLLHALFWVCMGLGATQYVLIELMTYSKMIADADGEEVEWQSVNVGAAAGGGRYMMVKRGTTQPVQNWHRVYVLHPPQTDDPWNRNDRPWWVPFLFSGIAAALGIVSGALLVVFIWHWPKKRYRWAMTLPFAVAGYLVAMYAVDNSFDIIRPWAMSVTLALAGLQSIAFFAGTLIGRPIARTMLRMFVPPKPRQHFNFLWRVDGKTPAALVQSS